VQLLVEIDLTNGCNHRCSFCQWGNYIQENRTTLSEELVRKTLRELKGLGTKSINWTGGGEPTLHKGFYRLLDDSYNLGLENGLLTNGSLLKNYPQLLEQLVWLRVSMSGGDRESYLAVQGRDDFDKVLGNLKELVDTAYSFDSKPCDIGVAFLLNRENLHTLIPLTERLINIGVDYLQIRQDMYSDEMDKVWWEDTALRYIEEAEAAVSGYHMEILGARYVDAQKFLSYPKKCHAHHFVAAINAEGHVCFCKNTRDNPDFWIGNIHERSLKDIWESSLAVRQLESKINPANCATFCKNMDINRAVEDVSLGAERPSWRDVRHPNFL
jgi:MoaA/NifB/PqqE/SkfB family radical SAM enzyme